MDQNPPKEPRTPVNLRIKFRSETLDQFIDRYAIDVSRGGIFIRTREPLAVGTQLKLDFQYQNGAPLMSGEGTVVWIRDPDPNRANVPPGMGVRFDRLSPESQTVLDQLLNDKASRERSGSSPVSNERSGGIAVRRPSSMFAALESERQLDQPPSAGARPSAPGPAAATFPGRPSAAYIPTVSALEAAGLKPSTVVPAAAPPPAQPRMTSSSLASGGAKAPAAPPAQATTAKAPLAGSSSGAAGASPKSSGDATVVTAPPTAPASAPSGAAGYRPLGSARNPFAGMPLQPSRPPAAGTAPGPAERMRSPFGVIDEKDAGPFPFETATPAAGVAVSGGEEDDELTDEPTQIAGRMPSFLLSADEDPTSVGSRPGQPLGDAAFLGGDPNDEPTRITSREVERPSRSAEPELRSLPGGRATAARPATGAPGASAMVPPAALGAAGGDRRLGSSPGIGLTADAGSGSEASRARQSLDLAPPVGSAGPVPPLGELRSTNQQLGIGGQPVSTPRSPETSGGGHLDPLSILDGMASSLSRPPDPLPPVSGTAATLLAATPAAPRTASAAHPASSNALLNPSGAPAAPPTASAARSRNATGVRRPSPALIGLTVVGLGAAAFFVFRYFASQSAQTASPPAIAVAVSPAGPAPEGNAPAAAKGTPEAPFPAAAGDETAPGVAPAQPAEKEATPQVHGAGAPAEGAAPPAAPKMGAPSPAGAVAKPSAPSSAGTAKPAGAESGTDGQAARTVAVVDSSSSAGGARKTNRRKLAKAGGATGEVPPPEGGEKPTPSDSAKIAASDAPVPPEGATDDSAAGHQIRVTSKPPGADVAIDGQVVGQTPLSTNISDVSSPHFLSVRKEGFETFEQMISATSAWAKTKGPRGQPGGATLKINAKLKASAAAAGGVPEAKGSAEASKAPTAAGDSPGAPAPAKEPPTAPAPAKAEEKAEGKAEIKIDKTMAPGGAEERAPTVP